MAESVTTTAAEPSATDVYALGRDPKESARLQRQSEELRSGSTALLDGLASRPRRPARPVPPGNVILSRFAKTRASR